MADHQAYPGNGSSRPRILIVEDDPMIAILVEQFVAELGCETIGPYHSMALGLLHAQTTVCDAAVVNLVLHGENAYPIAEALAARDIPFVFATGMPHDGFDGHWADRPYLDKPYEVKDLGRILVELLPNHAWTKTRGGERTIGAEGNASHPSPGSPPPTGISGGSD